MRVLSAILTLLVLAAACSKREPPRKIVLDTAAAEEEDGDVTCKASSVETGGQAFVIIRLDSAALRNAHRLQLNFVKQDSALPIHARLQATTGGAECDGNKSAVEFTVRGEQNYLALMARAGTTFAGINVKRLEVDQMINARAYTTDNTREELVWGDAIPGAMDNRPGRVQSTPAPPPYREPIRAQRRTPRP